MEKIVTCGGGGFSRRSSRCWYKSEIGLRRALFSPSSRTMKTAPRCCALSIEVRICSQMSSRMPVDRQGFA
eukprot:11023-Prymnesium_polylepis.1